MTDATYYLGFSAFPGIGPKRLTSLLHSFGSAKAAWEASQKDLEEVLGEMLSAKFESFRNEFSLSGYAQALTNKQIQYVTWGSEEYPLLLKPFVPRIVISNPEQSRMGEKSPKEISPHDIRRDDKERDSFPQGGYPLQRVEPLVQNDKKEIGEHDNEIDSGRIRSSLISGMTETNDFLGTTPFLPPFVLYVKGDVSVLQAKKTLGVVGTRKVTDYGREVTESLTTGLVERSFVIVSGLALGVDGIAHTTAIEHKGKTIAVLGSSVDFCTPREHQTLYDEILSNNGCVVSQFALGENVGRGNFPARNNIIAGISLGILVTEGAADSGSLLTAQDAQKLGRPVFSVPGPITSYLSKGTNNLIKQGVTPISEVSDIMGVLNHVIPDLRRFGEPSPDSGIGDPVLREAQDRNLDSRFRPKSTSFLEAARGNDNKTVKGDTEEEQEIIDILKNESLQFDEIVRRIRKDSKTVGSLLSLLELKGIVKSNKEGKYRL